MIFAWSITLRNTAMTNGWTNHAMVRNPAGTWSSMKTGKSWQTEAATTSASMANGLNVSGITNAAKKKIACQNLYVVRQAQPSVLLAITKAYPLNLMAARSFAAAVLTCTPRHQHGNRGRWKPNLKKYQNLREFLNNCFDFHVNFLCCSRYFGLLKIFCCW